MLPELTAAFAMLALCVVVHSFGLSWLLRRLAANMRSWDKRPNLLGVTRTLIYVASWLLLLHLVEISFWALFYYWKGCLPDWETALYFSGVTYATVGYGDVLLPLEWRVLGPIEGLTGILMCGLSTGFFFLFVSRLNDLLTHPGRFIIAAHQNEPESATHFDKIRTTNPN